MSLQNAFRAVCFSDAEDATPYPEHVKTGSIENPALPKPFSSFSKKEPFFVASDEPIPILGQGQTCRLRRCRGFASVLQTSPVLLVRKSTPCATLPLEGLRQSSLLIRIRDLGNDLIRNNEFECCGPAKQKDMASMAEVDDNARVGNDDRGSVLGKSRA